MDNAETVVRDLQPLKSLRDQVYHIKQKIIAKGRYSSSGLFSFAILRNFFQTIQKNLNSVNCIEIFNVYKYTLLMISFTYRK